MAPSKVTMTNQCLRLGPMSTMGAYMNCTIGGTRSAEPYQPMSLIVKCALRAKNGIVTAAKLPPTPYGVPVMPNSHRGGCFGLSSAIEDVIIVRCGIDEQGQGSEGGFAARAAHVLAASARDRGQDDEAAATDGAADRAPAAVAPAGDAARAALAEALP